MQRDICKLAIMLTLTVPAVPAVALVLKRRDPQNDSEITNRFTSLTFTDSRHNVTVSVLLGKTLKKSAASNVGQLG